METPFSHFLVSSCQEKEDSAAVTSINRLHFYICGAACIIEVSAVQEIVITGPKILEY